MSETRNITCLICGNSTDNSGNPLGTVELPDNTPETTWATFMSGFICDRSTCTATHQQYMDQVRSVLTTNYRKTLLHDVFAGLQADVQSGKTLAQALTNALRLM